MPIKVDKSLPALDILRSENIFAMDDNRASHQDIRPLAVLIVNLMPTKEATETQLLRLLANTPLQLTIDFLHMESHQSKNTKPEHLKTFYKTFADISDKYYDGLIITGAPVETLAFEEVDYWGELCQILSWSKTHAFSTLHLCWGAQAGLYYNYGIDKVRLSQKLSGIYTQEVLEAYHPLMRGFDDVFSSPHSRYTEVLRASVEAVEDLEILAAGSEVGLSLLASRDLREIYSFGHMEYDRDTLQQEYLRDLAGNKAPAIPKDYFPEDDPTQQPRMCWHLAAATFFSNWINAVYQETPYDLRDLDSTLD
ncbi:homoserine O-succinyltransferase [Streptococcus sp. zg-JUN1979]|uniref:homoserine O-succinyltransferase n=1 Tax=Streptococcus sp. zg-JUN1979 TaxID=3391450 RepID=UPI0039A4957F